MAESVNTLLVELGCEELPPKALAKLAESFFENTCKGLEEAGISFDQGESRYYFSPRRMTLMLADVAAAQADRVLERKGPAVAAAFDADGNPTPAAKGFAGSVGLAIEDLDPVKSATVRIRPGGVLQVDVRPRVPVVIWRNRKGLDLVDVTGAHVSTVDLRMDRPDLPLIAGIGATDHPTRGVHVISRGRYRERR